MLLFLVGIVLVVAVLVGGYLLERKRRDKLMQVALARGWTYAARTPAWWTAGRASRSVTVTTRAPATS